MSELTKDEKSLLLYFETCIVDFQGMVEPVRMNDEDRAIAKRWTDEGFLYFGRLPYAYIAASGQLEKPRFAKTNFVVFTERAWQTASLERHRRSDRMISNIANIPHGDLLIDKYREAITAIGYPLDFKTGESAQVAEAQREEK